MIKFEVLAIKIETDNIHAIFLLKKNIRSNIIKMILGYIPITALETLKKQKVAIILVEQRYKSTESRYDYRTGTGITYRGRVTLIEIGKSKDNHNKDGKPRCFNCNVYRHIIKDCQKTKKKKKTRKCYKCYKVKHLVKDCRLGQK